MATTTVKIEKRVSDAVRAAGGKVKELTDEQRQRAAAPQEGLRGKALGEWVLTGGTQPAEQPTSDEARYAELAGNTQGRTSKEQKEFEALRTKLGKGSGAGTAKANGGTKRQQWPLELRVASARAREVRGYGPGPKQHHEMRQGLLKALDGKDVTQANLLAVLGAKNLKELTAVAAKAVPVGTATNLKSVGKLMGEDAWCKGGHLAAATVAWIDELTDSPDYLRLRAELDKGAA